MATIRVDQLSSKTPADDDVVIIANVGGFYTWTGAALQTYAGSGGGSYSESTLTASSETSMRIRYSGTAPTLSKTAAGEYLLSVPTGCIVKGFHWQESSGTYTGGAVNLTIRDADGEYLMGIYQVFSNTSGDQAPSVVTINQTKPTAGDVLTVFTNMSLITGDWLVVGTIAL